MPNSWNLLQCCRQPETLGMELELELVEPPSPAQWHGHNCTSQHQPDAVIDASGHKSSRGPGLRLLGKRLYRLGVGGLHGLHCSRWRVFPNLRYSQEATAGLNSHAVRATHAASQAPFPGHGLHFNCWFQAAVVILKPAGMPNSSNLLQRCRQPGTLGVELELVEPPSPAQRHGHNCTSQHQPDSAIDVNGQKSSRGPGLRLLGKRLYRLGVGGLHGLHCRRWRVFPNLRYSQEATAGLNSQAVRATHAASQAHYPGHGLHFNCWFQAAVVILKPAGMPNSSNLLQRCRQPGTLGVELELVEPPSPAQWGTGTTAQSQHQTTIDSANDANRHSLVTH